jgi:hypothetical protein
MSESLGSIDGDFKQRALCSVSSGTEDIGDLIYPGFDNINSVMEALERIHQKLMASDPHDQEVWIELYNEVICGNVEVEDIGMTVPIDL